MRLHHRNEPVRWVAVVGAVAALSSEALVVGSSSLAETTDVVVQSGDLSVAVVLSGVTGRPFDFLTACPFDFLQ